MHRTQSLRCLLVAIGVSIAVAMEPTPSIAHQLQDAVISNEAAETQGGSVLNGVYTADQARRGQETFQRACASCHKVSDQTGQKFQKKWIGTTINDIFDLIATTMPDGNPGSLTPEEYASVVAFFLKETGYPEGKQELPVASAMLDRIRIEPLKK